MAVLSTRSLTSVIKTPARTLAATLTNLTDLPILKTALLILLLLNLKSVPLTWHARFYRAVFTHFFFRRTPPKRAHLFAPVTTHSRTPPYECDLNLHKSNSTYLSDLDIARTHLVCHLTKGSFAVRRRRGEKFMYVALAGVTCLFRREIKPMVRYEVGSRVLGWDGKWFFVVSHFREVGGGGRLFASALSKYVFKNGSKTVPPEVVLRESKLLPDKPEGWRAEWEVEDGGSEEGSSTTTPMEEVKGDVMAEDAEREVKGEDGYWTWERVEEERKRGMELAKYMLKLDGLDAEYRNGVEEGLEKVGPFYPGY